MVESMHGLSITDEPDDLATLAEEKHGGMVITWTQVNPAGAR